MISFGIIGSSEVRVSKGFIPYSLSPLPIMWKRNDIFVTFSRMSTGVPKKCIVGNTCNLQRLTFRKCCEESNNG